MSKSENVLAVDVGGTHFRAGLFDASGRLLRATEDDTLLSGGRDWMLERIRERARELAKAAEGRLAACGASFGGPVDFERQRVRSIHVPGWEDFAFGGWMTKNLGLPSVVDNDANAGALGEFRFGAGRGTRSLFYITLSTGIGGGAILDGKLYRGRDSLAGEIGHVPVSDSKLACSCGGEGCLEAFCSGTAIAARGKELASRRSESVGRLLDLSGGSVEGITAEAVVRAASEGDELAVSIITEAARWLARALLTVIRIVNPDRIILGGGVAQAGELLLAPVRRTLAKFSKSSIPYSTEIVLASLGSQSPLYGAAALALDAAK